jgi:hypothetical protein
MPYLFRNNLKLSIFYNKALKIEIKMKILRRGEASTPNTMANIVMVDEH